MDPLFKEISLQDLLATGWEYRGEGNANLVIGLPEHQKILRIPKMEKPTTILGWLIDWLKEIFKYNYKKQVELERRKMAFYNQVIVPLIGKKFAQPAIEIQAYPSIIKKLEKELTHLRPEYRQHKKLQVWNASLFPDYTVLPKKLTSAFTECLVGEPFAIEIKPKQGWIPTSERKIQKCYFCLKQFLKVLHGDVRTSSYCPLDLFSGQHNRMLKALKALVHAPQNNFKIFKNGTPYYGEGDPFDFVEMVISQLFDQQYTARLQDSFYILLLQALLSNFCDILTIPFKNACHLNSIPLQSYVDEWTTPSRNDVCSFVGDSLPKGCVLETILALQKYNHLGLDEYKDIYEDLKQSDFQFDEWSYIDTFLKRGVHKYSKQSNITHKIQDLLPYLLASVAYDCSFMITLCRVYNKPHWENIPYLITVDNHHFLVKIGIFDLYPKPANTIIKHVERNTEFFSHT